jgi:hypothetical protein
MARRSTRLAQKISKPAVNLKDIKRKYHAAMKEEEEGKARP